MSTYCLVYSIRHCCCCVLLYPTIPHPNTPAGSPNTSRVCSPRLPTFPPSPVTPQRPLLAPDEGDETETDEEEHDQVQTNTGRPLSVYRSLQPHTPTPYLYPRLCLRLYLYLYTTCTVGTSALPLYLSRTICTSAVPSAPQPYHLYLSRTICAFAVPASALPLYLRRTESLHIATHSHAEAD